MLDLCRIVTIEAGKFNTIESHFTDLAQCAEKISFKVTSHTVKLKCYGKILSCHFLRSA